MHACALDKVMTRLNLHNPIKGRKVTLRNTNRCRQISDRQAAGRYRGRQTEKTDYNIIMPNSWK